MNCPIIDCHCHVYPEKIALKATQATGNFYDCTMYGNGTIEDLLQSGEKAGITHYVIFSVATTPKQVSSVNAFIARSVKEHANMTGLGTMHPESDDPERDIEQIQALGLKGVKLHPDIQGFRLDDPRCMKIFELCQQRGLCALLHTGDNRYDYSNPDRLITVLKAFPNLKVVGAHFGGWSIWEQAAEQLHTYANLMVDCSSSFSWLDKETTRRILTLYGADKVLFGVDYPMWSHKKQLDHLLDLQLPQEDLEKILYRNARKFFNIY